MQLVCNWIPRDMLGCVRLMCRRRALLCLTLCCFGLQTGFFSVDQRKIAFRFAVQENSCWMLRNFYRLSVLQLGKHFLICASSKNSKQKSKIREKWWGKSYLIVPSFELLNFFHLFLTTWAWTLFPFFTRAATKQKLHRALLHNHSRQKLPIIWLKYLPHRMTL